MRKSGFKPFKIENVDLLYGQVRTVDTSLQIGDTADNCAALHPLQRPLARRQQFHFRRRRHQRRAGNLAAFSTPAKYTWGNLGCYIANGPGAYEIDTSLSKKFRLTERYTFDLRASAFNLLNHPQFSNPASNISPASFGQITSILNDGATGSGAPRRIEFMLRLVY
jgi:hypothetical protein